MSTHPSGGPLAALPVTLKKQAFLHKSWLSLDKCLTQQFSCNVLTVSACTAAASPPATVSIIHMLQQVWLLCGPCLTELCTWRTSGTLLNPNSWKECFGTEGLVLQLELNWDHRGKRSQSWSSQPSHGRGQVWGRRVRGDRCNTQLEKAQSGLSLSQTHRGFNSMDFDLIPTVVF